MKNLSLERAKVKLLMNNPFFASIAMKMDVQMNSSIENSRVNGKTLEISPEYLESLSPDERVTLLAHNVMHIALYHHLRRNNRDKKMWNEACDYVVNNILQESGFKLPEDAKINARYKDMNADQIYRVIEENANPQNGGGGGNGSGDNNQDQNNGGSGGSGSGDQWEPGDGVKGGLGDVDDHPQMGESPQAQLESEQKLNNEAAALTAKQAGKLPGNLETMIEEIMNPKIPWADMLKQILSEKSFDDYTWQKPNRRYMGTGFYMPSLENETYGEVMVFVDSSCSVTDEELAEYAGELNSIGEINQNKATVVYCDTQVQKVDEFEDEPIKLHVKGRGGTDFRPPFEWVDKEGKTPKLAIYFTDGWCSSFPKHEPDYDVIWCISTPEKQIGFDPPFGEVVYIN